MAAHALIAVPEYQTREAISGRLGLPVQKIGEALEFLRAAGLARSEGERFVPGVTHTHLGADSPLIAMHHANWRLRAIESFGRQTEHALHYSSVASLSREAVSEVQRALVKALDAVRGSIDGSKDEAVWSVCMDFFEV